MGTPGCGMVWMSRWILAVSPRGSKSYQNTYASCYSVKAEAIFAVKATLHSCD